MKKYKLEYTLKDKKLIFKLATIGYRDLFNHPEILKLRNESGWSVFHSFVKSRGHLPKEDVQFVLNFPNIHKYKDKEGQTPLHCLGWKCCVELLKHPMMNTLYDSKGYTPYMDLLKSVPARKLKECIILEELTRKSKKSHLIPWEVLEKRSHSPTIGQMIKWGIPIPTGPGTGYLEGIGLRRTKTCKLNWLDIQNYKKQNALRFIIED